MLPRRASVACPVLAVSLILTSPISRADDGPLGFSPASRAAERESEAKALAVPTPENARSWLRTLTEEPHVAGTPADRKTAEFVRDKLRSWGWEADLAEYEVLLNYPVQVNLAILRPERKDLKLMEDPYNLDKDSNDPDAFPAFNGYGVSGEVVGQVVYGNYGTPDDFDALAKMGVDVKGKVVLLRYYGGLFRGLKVLNAQKRGAAGVLIYSDPADDGYARGDVYPRGPYRPASGIQRGSVMFLSHGPGDPSTPGWASTKDARRLPIDPLNGFPTATTRVDSSGKTEQPLASQERVERWETATGLKREEYFATIPSLPISYEAALPILEGLGGPAVPGDWHGGLPLTYHVGPGPVEVGFRVEMDYKVRTIWNVIGKLKGEVEPDRWVMIGNHRDAWVYGAVDPNSGTASTLEACRALGEAVKAGWKPRRTILYASWDAEEYGLVGSTEWAEEHADELQEKALLMLNVDSAVSGPNLDIDGIPSLRELVLGAAADVIDPRSGKNLRETWLSRQKSQWAKNAPLDLDQDLWSGEAPSESEPAPFLPRLNALGSGSDYTPFVDHIGVPALDVNFGGGYGVYHSIYDNFFWMEHFCDPDFVIHATAAKLYTLIAMRAASADVAPLRFTPYAEALRTHVNDLRRTVAQKARAADPDAKEKPISFEGLPKLVESIRRFEESAGRLDQSLDALDQKDEVSSEDLTRLNDALLGIERAFLSEKGLPNRPWFRHTIYAPGLTTGYASWPLPGIHQAILENDPAMLAAQMPILLERLDAVSHTLDEADELAGQTLANASENE